MLVRPSKALRELRELIRIVSATGPRKRQGLALDRLESSVLPQAQMYRAIRDNSEIGDSALRKKLGSDYSEAAEEAGFVKLKSRLKLGLLQTIFFLDLGGAGYSNYSQVLYWVHRQVFLARTLSSLGSRELATTLAKAGLARAMSIEEWTAALEFLVILRANYSQAGDRKGFRFALKEFERCQKLLAGESMARYYFENLQLAFATSGGEKSEHAEIARKGAEELAVLAQQFPYFKFQFLSLRLSSQAAQLQFDHFAALSVCDRAFELLDRFPLFANPARYAEYAITRLVSAVHLGDNLTAEKAIVQCKVYLSPRTNNWFTAKEFEFLHLMHNLRFQEAQALVLQVVQHQRFGIQTEACRDRWSLFRMYSEYANGLQVPIKQVADFAALAQTYVGDKAGLNTAIMILHLLLLAERGNFSDLRERSEFFRGYKSRHLKRRENAHSAHFFSMIALIESCDLNFKKIASKSKPMLDKLKQLESSEPMQGVVILPYSYVWSRLMEALSKYSVLAHKTN